MGGGMATASAFSLLWRSPWRNTTPVFLNRKPSPTKLFFSQKLLPPFLSFPAKSFVAPVSCHPTFNFADSSETEGCILEYSFDGTRITRFVHSLWKEVISPGDFVIDATCGNGHDTLVLAKLALKENTEGCVYAFDLQHCALQNTSSLLDVELTKKERERVHLFQMCHSKLGEVVTATNSASVVAFNLGYLPGGDKSVITESITTIKALESAIFLLKPKGMITIVSYVGHQGGREEYNAVRSFAAGLPTTDWVCSQQEWLNRPLCPRLIVLFKK